MSKQRGLSADLYMYSASAVIEYILENRREELLDELGDDIFGEGYAEEVGYIRENLRIRGRVPTVTAFRLRFPDFVFYELKTDISDCIEYLKRHRTFMVFLSMYDKIDKFVDEQNFDMAISTYIASLDKIAVTLDIKNKTVSDTEEMIKEIEEAEQGKVYIPTGLEGFDDKFEGFLSRGSDLSILVARTGEGKTWLLLKMYLTALQNGYRAGFYSPEMPATEIQMRLNTWLGKFNFREMLGGKMSAEERERFLDFQEEWKKYNGFIYDDESFRSTVTVADIDKIIRKDKLQVVFIDGFKYINDIKSSSYTSLTERMSNVARDLMSLSKRHRIPIICSIQANRGGVEGSVPALEHIRDSDAVAHIATNVLSIRNKYNIDTMNTDISLRVIKSRRNFIAEEFKYEAKFGVGQIEFVGSGLGHSVKRVNDNLEAPEYIRNKKLNKKTDDGDDGGGF